jgi:hypothetical protein
LYSLSGGAVNIDGKEDKTNKQNDLTADVTNLKYPTVTAVNTGLATKQKNTLLILLQEREQQTLPKFTEQVRLKIVYNMIVEVFKRSVEYSLKVTAKG